MHGHDLVVTKTIFMIKLKTAFFLLILLGLVSFAPSTIFHSFSDKEDNSNNLACNALKTELAINKGQLVLINFWASHNASSRIENIKFASLMNNYRYSKFENAKGFVVISVSLDTYPSVFDETVKRDGLSITQNINATKGFDSKLAHNYKLGNEFGNLLLDAKGEVLAKNLSANELKELLKNKHTN